MRKALLAISILVATATGTATAEYTVKVPLELNQGGNLPNGSIRITSNWSNAPTVYGEWIDQEQPYDCNNWFPADSTVPFGETFTQTATDCSQDQTRTAQDQEVETISGIVRDKGESYTQSRTITVSSTRDSIGTLKHPWEVFADARGLSKNWNSLLWNSKGLTTIPTEPYPQTSVITLRIDNNQLTNVDGLSNLTSVNNLDLHNNQLTNVDGLRNLTSVEFIHLYENQLTNVDRLSNLTSVKDLNLHNNQLTNVNGLSNLTSASTLNIYNNKLTDVDGLSKLTSAKHLDLSNNQITNVYGLRNLMSASFLNLFNNKLTNVDVLSNLKSASILYLNNNKLTNVNGLSNLTSVQNIQLNNNQLTNINGLAKLEISNSISIDSTYAGPKLAATTRFCSLNLPDKFTAGFAQKTQLCESP